MTQDLQAAQGYILLAARGCPTIKLPIQTADQAVAAWERYRDNNGLGASDLKRGCGEIKTFSGVLVARVSYNGRVWNPEGKCIQDIAGGLPLPADKKEN
jgi:hypothetical protein